MGLSEAAVPLAAHEVEVGELGVDLEELVEVVDGLAVVFFACVDDGSVVAGAYVIGVHRQHSVHVGESLVKGRDLHLEQAAVEERHAVEGLKLQGVVVVVHGAEPVVAAIFEESAVDVQTGIVRLQFYGGVDVHHGLRRGSCGTPPGRRAWRGR